LNEINSGICGGVACWCGSGWKSFSGTEAESESDVNVFCYMVEHCIQRAQHNQVIFCPRHGNLGPYFIASKDGLVFAAHAAPDLVCCLMQLISLSSSLLSVKICIVWFAIQFNHIRLLKNSLHAVVLSTKLL